MHKTIDLRSDTVTKPTEAMRMAMYRAEVGDDVYEEDPTVHRLEALAADLTGQEAGLFVTSGTQGNLVALLAHCQNGDEVILEANSHIFMYEVGGMAAVGGLIPVRIQGHHGFMEPEDIRANVRGENIHFPRTSLLCIENTHNRCGGTVIDVPKMQAMAQVAEEMNLKTHVDGARIFNAAAALQCDVKELTAPMDSVQFCLSKGLAAPIGSMLVGSQDFIYRARRYRKMLGGGLRQVGVIAAAGIVALETMRERLSQDHDKAARLADALMELPGILLDRATVQTNIIIFEVTHKMGAIQLAAKMKEQGVLCNATSATKIRLVTHCDVTKTECLQAVAVIEDILST